MAAVEAAQVVSYLQLSQASSGRPLSEAETDLLTYHLEGLYAIKCPSVSVVSHAASMLRSFVQGSPLPPLDPIADAAARMLAEAKVQEAQAGHAAAASAVVAVKPEPSSGEAEALAPARRGRRERKASVKKEETLEDMPPPAAAKGRGRRAVKRQEYEEDDDGEEDCKPTPAKKSGGRKRKAVESTPEPVTWGGLPEFDIDLYNCELEPALPKAPKKSRSKYAAITGEQALDDEGWMAYAPSIIYKCPLPEDPTHKYSKVAAFDVMDTLLKTKSGMPFAKTPDDWRLYNENVPSILQSLHSRGYRIVILNNQGNIRGALNGKASQNERSKYDLAADLLGVPITFVLATQTDIYRKPNAGMWNFLVEHLSPGVKPDVKSSFYVGDASSPECEPNGDTDRAFAYAAGLAYQDVVDVFGSPIVPKKVRPPAPKPGKVVDNIGDLEINTRIARALETKHAVVKAQGGNRFELAAIKRSAGIISEFPIPLSLDPAVLQRLSDTKYIGKSTMADVQAYLTSQPLSF